METPAPSPSGATAWFSVSPSPKTHEALRFSVPSQAAAELPPVETLKGGPVERAAPSASQADAELLPVETCN